MPRYRFHLFNDVQTQDLVGRIFPDVGAAQVDAIRSARALMCEDMTGKGEINLSHWIELEDDDGEVTVVPFRDAVTIRS
jgi:hypothetical protein